VGAGSRVLAVTGLLRRPLLSEETHQVTSFEVFFDLVFVFAIIRVTNFITTPLTWESLAEGILLVLLLWSTWSAYAWVGNQTRADTGLLRAGVTVAMAAIFVAGLVMPEAWNDRAPLDPPVVIAVAFAIARVIYLALYLRATADDRLVRSQLLLDTIPQSLAMIAIIVGAVIGGAAQSAAWAVAFAVDFSGGRGSSGVRGYRLRSPGHFAERHSLVMIIALGETLISVGEGAGITIVHWLVIGAAVLGLALVVCLWWLYAGCTAAAQRALEQTDASRRARMARDAYTLAHLPLIGGALYLAAGVEEVIRHLSQGHSTHTAALGWLAAIALYGGVALYLTGRVAFVRLSGGPVSKPLLVAAGVTVLLLPAAASLPAVAAMGLLCVLVAVTAGYDRRAAAGPRAIRPA
jgi:low temperature requirement protein LtrA